MKSTSEDEEKNAYELNTFRISYLSYKPSRLGNQCEGRNKPSALVMEAFRDILSDIYTHVRDLGQCCIHLENHR